VNRRDVQLSVEGLYISCSYSSYKNVTADDECDRGVLLLLVVSSLADTLLSVVVYLLLLVEGKRDGGDDDENTSCENRNSTQTSWRIFGGNIY